MKKFTVAIARYEEPLKSVKKAVALSKGLEHLHAEAKVFIKPNIVFWTKAVQFPKWGIITTSRVVEDMVVMIKEQGIEDITIGEGTVTFNPEDRETPAHAFESLGYHALEKRYGVKILNVFERPFEKIDLGDGVALSFNTDILHADLVVDLPVLKTHNQSVVSLGIKNLKGTIDINSRKRCHSADPERDLHFMISKLADPMPPIFTLIDGLYSNERGPSFDGRMKRANLLIASSDVLSADMVGARVLGYEPEQVPHLAYAARKVGRPLDLSDVELVGEPLEEVSSHHEYDFVYMENEEGNELPLPMARQGIKGLSYPKYDLSMCTYCSGVNGLILTAIKNAWKGEPWDEVEVLTGKVMKPKQGKKKTILLGKCIYQANKDNPDIQEMIPVKGCPPKFEDIIDALQRAGIEINPALFDQVDKLPGFFMRKYEGKPEFDESLFKIE
jgi:uncharacterized protein (DUF362 family)